MREMWRATILVLVLTPMAACHEQARSATPSAVTGDGGQAGDDGSGYVGEELLFSADDFADLAALTDPMHSDYAWTFGDDRTHGATTAPYGTFHGRSATHVYSTPGTYTVTLSATQGVDGGGVWAYPDSGTLVFTKTITVSGAAPKLPPLVSDRPLLELDFEDSIADSSAGQHTVTWGSDAGAFVAGVSGKAVDLSGGHYLVIPDPSSWLGGLSQFTISFWARKKDQTQEKNCILYQSGAPTSTYYPALRLTTYTNATAPSDCAFKMEMWTEANHTSTSRSVRDEYENTLWHHYAFTYDGAATHLYIDGRMVATGAVTGSLPSLANDVLIGYGNWDTSNTATFNGLLDEFKIYGRALTQRELEVGLEVWHADFHGHTKQYLYVQVPEVATSDATNRLVVSVSGGGLAEASILADRSALQSEEKVLLENQDLPGSQAPYVLDVQLLDEAGAVLFEQRESFSKTYDGAPSVGIDENNAIRVDGGLFFPVTPWGLTGSDEGTKARTYVDDGYVNALFGQGWDSAKYNVAGMLEYLDAAAALGVKAIGPATHWDGEGELGSALIRCSDLGKAQEYIQALRAHSALMMWSWADEPDLYGMMAPQLRSLTLAAQQLDPQHLSIATMVGHPYASYNDDTSYHFYDRHEFTYLYNALEIGARRPVTDVVAFDYYPIDDKTDAGRDTVSIAASILDTVRAENYDLLPVMTWVETADPSNGSKTPWPISAEQLAMVTWLNVVHGAKGIFWFHYFGTTPDANYAFMAAFQEQITALAPVVLGPATARTVTTSIADGGTGRVDTMLREYDGKQYLFAVRVSEVAYQDSTQTSAPPAEQNYPIDVTFDLGADAGTQAVVYGEDRTLALSSSSQLTDIFAPFAVHVYVVE